jgi:hypothetical protein
MPPPFFWWRAALWWFRVFSDKRVKQSNADVGCRPRTQSAAPPPPHPHAERAPALSLLADRRARLRRLRLQFCNVLVPGAAEAIFRDCLVARPGVCNAKGRACSREAISTARPQLSQHLIWSSWLLARTSFVSFVSSSLCAHHPRSPRPSRGSAAKKKVLSSFAALVRCTS